MAKGNAGIRDEAKTEEHTEDKPKTLLSIEFKELSNGKIETSWNGLSTNLNMANNQIDHISNTLKIQFHKYLIEQQNKMMEEQGRKMKEAEAKVKAEAEAKATVEADIKPDITPPVE
jgi:hypothetical protein